MRIVLSIVLITLVAGITVPPAAEAQGITKKIRMTAKQRVKDRTAQTEEHILHQTGSAVDSAMAPAAEGVDSVVSAAVGAATGLPRVLATAVDGAGDARRIREALETGRAVLPGIAFVPGSAQLDESAEPYLLSLAEAMEALGGSFLIESYVEPGGRAAVAQALSEARAGAVKAWLVEDGLDEAQIFAVGRGAAASNEHETAQTRVEVVWMQ